MFRDCAGLVYGALLRCVENRFNAMIQRMKSDSDCKMFVSHRSKDAALADSVVKLVTQGFYVAKSGVLCTSVPETRCPNGSYFAERLPHLFKWARFCIYLVTQDYTQSKDCLAELAWAAMRDENELFLFRIGDWSYDSLSSLTNARSMDALDMASLMRLRRKLAKVFRPRVRVEEWRQLAESLVMPVAEKAAGSRRLILAEQLALCAEINAVIHEQSRQQVEAGLYPSRRRYGIRAFR